MKIAFFSDNFYPELSGIADSIIDTGRELASRGHQIDYFVPRYSAKNYHLSGVTTAEIELGKNITIHRLSSIPVPTPTLQGRASIPKPWRGILAKNKFDIIHSHSFFNIGIDGLLTAKIGKIPLVGTNHTVIKAFTRYLPFKSRWLGKTIARYMNWYYRSCDEVTTPALFLANEMKIAGLKKTPKVIPNPIAENFYHPTAPKSNLKQKLGFAKITFLYVGRMAAEKNIDDLIEAFIRIEPLLPDAELILVGQGILKDHIRSRIIEIGLTEKIKLLGPFFGQTRTELYDIFHAADVFVIPSTSEVQSMVVLQAMASKLPIIAAKAAGLPDIVLPQYGWLFPPGDIETLSEYLQKIYNDHNARQTMGEQAGIFAEQYRTAKVADAWENLYTDTIKNYADNH